jgi:mono/diheme cytochrome c family protein
MTSGIVKQYGRAAPVPTLSVAATPARIARGAILADSFCGACHSAFFPMQGGMDIGRKFPLPLGSFVSANLTPAGPLRHWSDGQVFRAIRNGVDAEGRWLMIMSMTNAGSLSDEDIEAVIAYLRSLPAGGGAGVDPPDHFSPMGLVMLGAGMLPKPKPVITRVITSPPQGPSAQYGNYLAGFSDCTECHGTNLLGRAGDGVIPTTPGLAHVQTWSAEQFIATLRNGVDPYGHALGTEMPWRSFGKMTDEDLTAVYEYVVATVRQESANAAQ